MVLICVSCEPEKHVLQPTTGTVIDYEGNIYQTIKIDDQWWMAENLRTTRYNDGSEIPHVTYFDDWRNLTTPAYVWYNNDPLTYKATYGALYNWYAVNTGNLCPAGWHVPTDDEWSNLAEYLGGESIAGGKMKESGTLHWNSPNDGATNESGFTALPGGYRYGDDGQFWGISQFGSWWSSSEIDATLAWHWQVVYQSDDLVRYQNLKRAGLSVRCLKD
jgi:uncharacterized protein (TIGR02145 family)